MGQDPPTVPLIVPGFQVQDSGSKGLAHAEAEEETIFFSFGGAMLNASCQPATAHNLHKANADSRGRHGLKWQAAGTALPVFCLLSFIHIAREDR